MLTALIILALVGLVVGMALKFSGHAAGAGASGGAAFALPPGAKIVGVQAQANRLILQVHTAQGDEVDVIDLDDGRLVTRIRAAP